MRFIRAIYSEWGSGVTGTLSAPFFVVALLTSGVPRIASALFAIGCFYYAAYRIWSRTDRELSEVKTILSGFPVISAAHNALRHEDVYFTFPPSPTRRVSAMKLYVTNLPIINAVDSTAEVCGPP